MNNKLKPKKRSSIRRCFKIFGSARVKLSVAMALSVFTLVLLAQLLNLLPDRNTPIMNARQLQTQTLAMAGSAMLKSKSQLGDFEQILRHAKKADDQLLSLGLRNMQDKLLLEVEDHASHWATPQHGKSTDQFMFVPIFQGNKQFATLELRYQPLSSVSSLVSSPIFRFGACLFGACLVIFYIILGRTLKQLDPRGAVPKHVREAFDHMAEGLLVMDRYGSIMMANSKFGSLVGVEPEELVGQDSSNFPWLATEELPWKQAVRLKQSVSNLSIKIEDQEGTPRTFSVSAAPVVSANGACRGVMVTFDDITSLEEHKMELIEARKIADAANEAKSNFLSRMSHEIRTPMNAIIGYADILREGVTDQADQNQYLSTIHSSGEHLLTLINDILDLSKIEAGQMTLEKRAFAIAPLLAQVIDTLRLKTDQKGLELKLQIDGKIPAQIVNDETRLRQVLINIIGNAVKFTHEGGVMLIVRMSQDQRMLEFDVADTGVGIPADSLDTIFKPFSQADDSVTRKFGGTGLGLAICKELSESMGGEIGVQSKEGVGTVFSFSIDPGQAEGDQWLTNDDVASQAALSLRPKAKTTQFKKSHILIVDDGQTNRKLAGVILKRMGLTFEEACNGEEAIEKITRNSYDVVLMDISMPVMDGLTAAGKLRAMGEDTPRIALTAFASAEERSRCLEGGFHEFLPKPIRWEKLVDVLQKFIPLEVNDSDSAAANHPAIELSKRPSSENLSEEKKSDLVVPDVVRSTFPMDEEIKELLVDYVIRMRTRLNDFDEAWKNRDLDTLQNHAHWLAGSAGTIGLEDFVDPAREIEHSDGSNPERIELLLQHIHELAARVDISDEALSC